VCIRYKCKSAAVIFHTLTSGEMSTRYRFAGVCFSNDGSAGAVSSLRADDLSLLPRHVTSDAGSHPSACQLSRCNTRAHSRDIMNNPPECTLAGEESSAECALPASRREKFRSPGAEGCLERDSRSRRFRRGIVASLTDFQLAFASRAV